MITPAVPDPPELDDILWKDFDLAGISYDVGANCGQTLDRIGEFSDLVVAFEPAVEAFEYLRAHYGHRMSITLSDLAVTSHDGTVELMAAPSKIETGQLVTHGTEGMEWSEDEMANGVVRTLPATTLDSFARNQDLWPDFIKIDVEGHEVEVLRGASDVLKFMNPMMLIEVHSEALGETIKEMLEPTYFLDLVRHPHYQPGSLLWRTHFWYRCFPKTPVSEI